MAVHIAVKLTQKMADVAHEVDAIFMVDMAHFAGLVAAGLHPNPVRIC